MVAFVLGLVVASLAVAQQPATKRIRGAIEGVDGAVMTVKTREGPSVPINLAGKDGLVPPM